MKAPPTTPTAPTVPASYMLWERVARPADFTGRLLSVYRASGRPA